MQRNWKECLVRRRTVWKTTWLLRLTVVAVSGALGFSTRGIWLPAIGHRLIHDDAPTTSDAIVIENYDQDYLTFELASRLLRRGYAPRLIIPVAVSGDPEVPNAVYEGFMQVMTQIARIEEPQTVLVEQTEPITLSVARQVSKTLAEQRVESVIVVAPRFRSRRTFEVYRRVLAPLDVQVLVMAAGGTRTGENWWHTTHGIQQVFLEFVKLQYYLLFVL